MYAQLEMFSTKHNYNANLFRLEGIPVIWYKYFGTQPVTIQAGDFIRARKMPVVCGFVVAHIELHMGRKVRIPGYQVRLASGHIDFIPEEDAELVG